MAQDPLTTMVSIIRATEFLLGLEQVGSDHRSEDSEVTKDLGQVIDQEQDQAMEDLPLDLDLTTILEGEVLEMTWRMMPKRITNKSYFRTLDT